VDFHRTCISSALTALGERHPSIRSCAEGVLSSTHGFVRFVVPAGVGRDRNVSISVLEGNMVTASSALTNLTVFSYFPPSLDTVDPGIVRMTDGSEDRFVDVYGRYFGNPELATAQQWSAEERFTQAVVGGVVCRDTRARRESGETVVRCTLAGVGAKNMTLYIAGQSGYKSEAPLQRALRLVCSRGYFGRPNETCLACPAVGAECQGYLDAVADDAVAHSYPKPLAGFYNLNGSEASACPAGVGVAGRDVCVVACEPMSACLGDNVCAEGYTSKAPMFRCASCARGYFRRSGECIKCPDSPWALVIGFVLLIVAGATVGFILNRKNINVAVISIGIDFFQVLGISAWRGRG